jgi:hypothetical protein
MLLALMLMLQIPWVQTFLGKKLAHWVSGKTGFSVQLDRLTLSPWDGVGLYGVNIAQGADTLIFAQHIAVDIADFSLKSSSLTIREVMLEDGGIYLIRHATEDQTNLDRFIKAFQPAKTDKTPKKSGDFTLHFQSVRLCNARFALLNEAGPHTQADFRSEDLGIRGIYGVVHDFHIHKDTIAMKVEDLAAIERSGLVLKKLSGDFFLNAHTLALKKFSLQTGHSQINGDFAMHFKDWTAFQHFAHEVSFQVHLGLSNLSFKDLQFFSSSLKGWEGDVRLRGEIRGPLADLKFRDLRLLVGTVTQIDGQLDILGLPEMDKTYFYADLEKMVTSAYDLQRLPLPPVQGPNGPEPMVLQLPREINRLGVIRFSGHFDGFLHDFSANGDLQTSIGGLGVDMEMQLPRDGSLPTYHGNLMARKFHLGQYLDIPDLGEVSFSGQVHGKGLMRKDLDASFEGEIESFTYLGYPYQQVAMAASFREDVFKGTLHMADPNATFDFSGEINLEEDIPHFNFSADVHELHPVRLKLLTLDSDLVVQVHMDLDLKGSDIDAISGDVHFQRMHLQKGSRTLTMEDFSLHAEKLDAGKVIQLRSDFMDVDIDGTFSFKPLAIQLNNRLADLLPVAGFQTQPLRDTAQQDFSYALHFKNLDPFTQMFFPDLRIHPNSIAYGGFKSKDQTLQLSLRSGGFGYKKLSVVDFGLSVRNVNAHALQVDATAGAFFLTDSVHIDDLKLAVTTQKDSVQFGLDFSNHGPRLNAGHIKGTTYLGNAPMLDIGFSEAMFYYEDSLWTLGPSAAILMDSAGIQVKNLALFRFKETTPMFTLDGRIGEREEDELRATLRGFPVSLVNPFLAGGKVKLDGKATGYLSAFRVLDSPFFTAQMQVEHLALNQIPLGQLNLNSQFNNENRIITLNALLEDHGKEVARVRNAKIRPFDPEQLLDISLDLNQVDLRAFEKMMSAVFSEMHGLVSGRVNLRGSAADPFLNGALYLEKTRIRVGYLNAPFNLDFDSEPVLVSSRSIRFPKVRMRDDIKGEAQLSGVIYHKMFTEMDFNLHIQRIKDLQVMNTSRKDNPQFYGQVVLFSQDLRRPGGKAVTIKGPLEDLTISAWLDLIEGTEVSLPLDMRSSATENTFVTFVNSADASTKDSLDRAVVKTKAASGNLTLDLNVSVKPEARFHVIFDELTNDVLTAQGTTENFNLSMDLKDRFTMNGTFVIARGDYRFNLSNLVNRAFIIKNGSFVTWTGSPYTAQIEATAIHITRAPLLPIVAPFSNEAQQELYRRSTRIFCELNLTGKLLDPTLGFDLSLPDADENARSLVRSVLNSREEVNRQVFALLLLGNFLPPENIGTRTAGGSLAASGLGGNSLSLVSGQINNWLGNFTRDVNVNLEYQAGDQTTNQADRVTVGLQGQLFNDRVIIDGDLGVGARANGSKSQNSVMGNVTVEVKATNDGRLRVRAFNRSNEFNLLKNSVPYTQGVGLSYRREFDTWKELFRGNRETRKQARKLRDQRMLEDQITPPTLGDESIESLQEQWEEQQEQSPEETPNPDPGTPKLPEPPELE